MTKKNKAEKIAIYQLKKLNKKGASRATSQDPHLTIIYLIPAPIFNVLSGW